MWCALCLSMANWACVHLPSVLLRGTNTCLLHHYPVLLTKKVNRYVHGARMEDVIVLNKQAQPSYLPAQGRDWSTRQGVGRWDSCSVKPLSSCVSSDQSFNTCGLSLRWEVGVYMDKYAFICIPAADKIWFPIVAESLPTSAEISPTNNCKRICCCFMVMLLNSQVQGDNIWGFSDALHCARHTDVGYNPLLTLS